MFLAKPKESNWEPRIYHRVQTTPEDNSFLLESEEEALKYLKW